MSSLFPINSGSYVMLSADGVHKVTVGVDQHKVTPPETQFIDTMKKLVGPSPNPPMMVSPDLFIGIGQHQTSDRRRGNGCQVVCVARIMPELPITTQYAVVPDKNAIVPLWGGGMCNLHWHPDLSGEPELIVEDTMYWRPFKGQHLVHISMFYLTDDYKVTFPPENIFLTLMEMGDGTVDSFSLPLPNIYGDGRTCMGDETYDLCSMVGAIRKSDPDITTEEMDACDNFTGGDGGNGMDIGYKFSNCPFTLISRLSMRSFMMSKYNMDLFQDWMIPGQKMFRWDLQLNQVPMDPIIYDEHFQVFSNENVVELIASIVPMRNQAAAALETLKNNGLSENFLLDSGTEAGLTKEKLDALIKRAA